MPQGQLFVISAPSGAGKTSLVAAAIARVSDLVRLVYRTQPGARAQVKSMAETITLSINQNSTR